METNIQKHTDIKYLKYISYLQNVDTFIIIFYRFNLKGKIIGFGGTISTINIVGFK